jgi:hypothetical protein
MDMKYLPQEDVSIGDTMSGSDMSTLLEQLWLPTFGLQSRAEPGRQFLGVRS